MADQTQTTTTSVKTAPREDEFQYMFDEFMTQYFGIDDKAPPEELRAMLGYTDFGGPTTSSGESNWIQWDPCTSSGETNWKEWLRTAPPDEISNWENKTGTSKEHALAAFGVDSYKATLATAYEEEAVARQKFLDESGAATDTHSGLLTDIINGQMSGEAIGPYGQDIDNLLAQDPQSTLPWKDEMSKLLQEDPRVNDLLKERMSISFGSGDPMQFMTGSQQRTIDSLLGNATNRLGTLSGERQSFLNDLLSANSTDLKTLTGAQQTGLNDITNMSTQRLGTDLAVPQAEFELFQPSVQPQANYLNDLWSRISPNEVLRYGQNPNTTVNQDVPSTTNDWINNAGNAVDLGTKVLDWLTNDSG